MAKIVPDAFLVELLDSPRTEADFLGDMYCHRPRPTYQFAVACWHPSTRRSSGFMGSLRERADEKGFRPRDGKTNTDCSSGS